MTEPDLRTPARPADSPAVYQPVSTGTLREPGCHWQLRAITGSTGPADTGDRALSWRPRCPGPAGLQDLTVCGNR